MQVLKLISVEFVQEFKYEDILNRTQLNICRKRSTIEWKREKLSEEPQT